MREHGRGYARERPVCVYSLMLEEVTCFLDSADDGQLSVDIEMFDEVLGALPCCREVELPLDPGSGGGTERGRGGRAGRRSGRMRWCLRQGISRS